MEFSLNFRNKFKEWVCNNDSITLSAGVSVVNSKFPIGKAVDYSEKNLEVSKKSGKDKITIFNEVLSWQTKGQIKGYDDLLNYSYKLEKYYTLCWDDFIKEIRKQKGKIHTNEKYSYTHTHICVLPPK